MIELSKCDVCVFVARTGECGEGLLEHECQQFKAFGVTLLYDEPCPECSKRGLHGILFQDNRGAFCSASDCNFTQKYRHDWR